MGDTPHTECLIVGAGPAGLTAATYLARFRRAVVLADAGRSRARWIPVSRNTPGFPGGIDGESLLAELREQAARFGVEPRACRVEALRRDGDGFVATLAGEACREGFTADFVPVPTTLRAARVILATGVVDELPELDGCDAAIRAGIVRLCPVCDGFETDRRRVAVFGPADKVAGHARFLRAFSTDVTAVVSAGRLDDATRAELTALGIGCIEDCGGLVWDGRREVRVACAGGVDAGFDAFYPVLGARSQSKLAVALGAECTDLRRPSSSTTTSAPRCRGCTRSATSSAPSTRSAWATATPRSRRPTCTTACRRGCSSGDAGVARCWCRSRRDRCATGRGPGRGTPRARPRAACVDPRSGTGLRSGVPSPCRPPCRNHERTFAPGR
jgi:thioredoxin reductase (NADPH)